MKNKQFKNNQQKNKDVQTGEKLLWKAGNMVYPLPAVMVSCANKDGESNIITISWTGTICTNPPMVYISVRPERYSYDIIKETKEFVINLTTKDLAKATDFCGVRSGSQLDKWKETGLTQKKSHHLKYAPIIDESPLSIECSVKEILELGSHHMFIANVEGVQVDSKYMDDNGKFCLNDSNLLAYSHGQYKILSNSIGTFGYSVMKKKTKKKKFKSKNHTNNSKK